MVIGLAMFFAITEFIYRYNIIIIIIIIIINDESIRTCECSYLEIYMQENLMKIRKFT